MYTMDMFSSHSCLFIPVVKSDIASCLQASTSLLAPEIFYLQSM